MRELLEGGVPRDNTDGWAGFREAGREFCEWICYLLLCDSLPQILVA